MLNESRPAQKCLKTLPPFRTQTQQSRPLLKVNSIKTRPPLLQRSPFGHSPKALMTALTYPAILAVSDAPPTIPLLNHIPSLPSTSGHQPRAAHPEVKSCDRLAQRVGSSLTRVPAALRGHCAPQRRSEGAKGGKLHPDAATPLHPPAKSRGQQGNARSSRPRSAARGPFAHRGTSKAEARRYLGPRAPVSAVASAPPPVPWAMRAGDCREHRRSPLAVPTLEISPCPLWGPRLSRALRGRKKR